MKVQRVYDLPTRIFHWFFAFGFALTFLVAKTMDDESTTFSFHMLLGLWLLALVLLRVIWGIIGSKHARFSSFPLSPSKLIHYLKSVMSGEKESWEGHNPASSWAAIIMMLLVLGLAGTGILMSQGGVWEELEDIHELLANGFLVVVGAHLVGLALHFFRHRDGLVFSMISGSKEISEKEGSDKVSNHFLTAAVFLVIMAGFGSVLWKNFDPKTRVLTLAGYSLTLGENESENEHGGGEKGQEHEEHEEEHDDD